MSKKLNTRIAQNGDNIKRIMALILVLGMIIAVTGCSGGDSQTMGSRLNTENAVDKVLNQKTDSVYQERVAWNIFMGIMQELKMKKE